MIEKKDPNYYSLIEWLGCTSGFQRLEQYAPVRTKKIGAYEKKCVQVLTKWIKKN